MIHGNSKTGWYCLRSRLKREHLAAARLREQENIEVFLPRIRFRRPTRRGPVWATEALFPNYFFARFDWQQSLRQVHASRDVSGVVHFGDTWPTIPDGVIDDLRNVLGAEETHVIPPVMAEGDRVKIAGGSFDGLRAVVAKIMPGRERVAVLLEFLGQQTTVELGVDMLVRDADERDLIR